jgi:hypothetical protein
MSNFTIFTREENLKTMPLVSKAYYSITNKEYSQEFKDKIVIPEVLIAKTFLQMCHDEQLTIIN